MPCNANSLTSRNETAIGWHLKLNRLFPGHGGTSRTVEVAGNRTQSLCLRALKGTVCVCVCVCVCVRVCGGVGGLTLRAWSLIVDGVSVVSSHQVELRRATSGRLVHRLVLDDVDPCAVCPSGSESVLVVSWSLTGPSSLIELQVCVCVCVCVCLCVCACVCCDEG